MEEKNDEISIGDRLRRLIASRGEALTVFAARSGVPYRTLQSHIADKTKPNADQLAKISLIGIDVNFLLTGMTHNTPSVLVGNYKKDDNKYYVLSDPKIAGVIEQKARSIITRIIAEELAAGRDMSFDEMLTGYCKFLHVLADAFADVFTAANAPVADVKRF